MLHTTLIIAGALTIGTVAVLTVARRRTNVPVPMPVARRR